MSRELHERDILPPLTVIFRGLVHLRSDHRPPCLELMSYGQDCQSLPLPACESYHPPLAVVLSFPVAHSRSPSAMAWHDAGLPHGIITFLASYLPFDLPSVSSTSFYPSPVPYLTPCQSLLLCSISEVARLGLQSGLWRW